MLTCPISRPTFHCPVSVQVFVSQTDETCPTFVSVSSTLSNSGVGQLLLLTNQRLFVVSNIHLEKYLHGKPHCQITRPSHRSSNEYFMLLFSMLIDLAT